MYVNMSINSLTFISSIRNLTNKTQAKYEDWFFNNKIVNTLKQEIILFPAINNDTERFDYSISSIVVLIVILKNLFYFLKKYVCAFYMLRYLDIYMKQMSRLTHDRLLTWGTNMQQFAWINKIRVTNNAFVLYKERMSKHVIPCCVV